MNIPYIKENLQKLCDESDSYNEVLIKSGRTKSSSNIKTLKKYIDIYNIDVSHFNSITSPVKNNNNGITKVCLQCKQEKNIKEDFYLSNRKYARNICKDCVKENERLKYNNKVEEIENYKRTLECKKCGEKRFYLFDFHHKDPSQKDYAISEKTRVSLQKLKEEIDKCDVLCSNCHREWHYLLNKNHNINYDEWINN